jgi:hypothetical protein
VLAPPRKTVEVRLYPSHVEVRDEVLLQPPLGVLKISDSHMPKSFLPLALLDAPVIHDVKVAQPFLKRLWQNALALLPL